MSRQAFGDVVHFLDDRRDISSTIDAAGIKTGGRSGDISGAASIQKNGELTHVWLTESSRPYDAGAKFEPHVIDGQPVPPAQRQLVSLAQIEGGDDGVEPTKATRAYEVHHRIELEALYTGRVIGIDEKDRNFALVEAVGRVVELKMPDAALVPENVKVGSYGTFRNDHGRPTFKERGKDKSDDIER